MLVLEIEVEVERKAKVCCKLKTFIIILYHLCSNLFFGDRTHYDLVGKIKMKHVPKDKILDIRLMPRTSLVVKLVHSSHPSVDTQIFKK